VSCSAEAAAGARFVHVFVHNDGEVLDACLSDNHGALAGMEPGATLILHSTILPETTFAVAEKANARGVDVLDASVTAVPRRVAAGEATFLVGGADDVVAGAREHLRCLGVAVNHFGPQGSGNVAKIAKNLGNAVERIMWAETIAIVEAAGLDVRRFMEMAKSVSDGPMLDNWERVVNIDEDGHASPGRARGMFSKDIQHAARVAEAYGIDAPVTREAAAAALKQLAVWAAQEETAKKTE
jgi:3-hydroxyisobutyrate dehydrogenase